MDQEKVIKELEDAKIILTKAVDRGGAMYVMSAFNCLNSVTRAIDLLKEQEELLRKLQNDKDKLCLEVSKWKHKFHDAPPKFVSQEVVDQIHWERDTALLQLEQIGKGLGSKMDDIVALLKEQDAVEPNEGADPNESHWNCGACGYPLWEDEKYCAHCGRQVKWDG